MGILNSAFGVVENVNSILGGYGVGSGLGSALAGFDPELNRYSPLEPTLRSYGLVFIFLPAIFKYMFATHSPTHATLISMYEKYQHSFLMSFDAGTINVETEEIGADRPMARYKYPIKVTPPSSINMTLIDAYNVFSCMLDRPEICLLSEGAGIAERLLNKTGNLSKLTTRLQQFGESLGLLENGYSRSVLRPILEGWIDFFDKIVYARSGKTLAYLRQRILTDPDITSGGKGQSADSVDIPEELLQELLLIKKLSENNVIANMIIKNPGIVYKGAAIVCRITMDKKPRVLSANAYIGLFPLQFNLIDINWRDSDFDILNTSWSYDMLLTGEEINAIAEELVTELYDKYKPAEQMVMDFAASFVKTALGGLGISMDFGSPSSLTDDVNLCINDLGASGQNIIDLLTKNPSAIGFNRTTANALKNSLGGIRSLSGTGQRALLGMRSLTS